MGSGSTKQRKNMSEKVQAAFDDDSMAGEENIEEAALELDKDDAQDNELDNDKQDNDEENDQPGPVTSVENFTKKLENACEYFSKDPLSVNWATKEGKKIAGDLSRASLGFRKKHLNKTNRTEISKLSMNSDIFKHFFNYLEYVKDHFPEVLEKDEKVLKKSDEFDVDKRDHLVNAQYIICSFVTFFLNNTDISIEFCNNCVQVGIVGVLLEYLERYEPVCREEDKKDASFNDLKLNRRMMTINHIFGFFFNVSKCLNKDLAEMKTIHKLMPFVHCPIELFAMKSLLVVAYLIGEDENHMISSSLGPVKVYLNQIERAIKSKNNKCNGFRLDEQLEGLAKILQNDDNKILIAQNGGVDLLARAIKKTENLESEAALSIQEHAYRCLYLLSFNEDNKQSIIENAMVLECLHSASLKQRKVKKYTAGIMWELKGKKDQMMKMKEEKQDLTTDEKTKSNKGHVMISYQWSHQDIMLKVRDSLQENGYTVWIDLDEMQGSTLEAMANAVENAFLILMTISSNYKASANCRSEAEYAFQLKKPIIPLMMEKNYQADGWLGFIVGAKLWIDLTDRTKLNKSLIDLKNEIERRGFSGDQQNQAQLSVVQSEPSSNNEAKRRDEILQWSYNDVLSWVHSNNCRFITEDVTKKHLNGEVLLHLLDLRLESPETFFKLLRKKLEIDSLKNLFKFADCIKNLLDEKT